NDGKNGGTTGNYLVINSDLTENEEINEKISGSGDLSEVEKVSDTYFKESGGSISSGASDGGGGSDEIDTPINNPFKDLEYNTGDVIEVNGNNIIYAGTQNRDGEEYILMTYDASDLGDSGRLFKDGTKDKWTKNDGDNWRSCNVYIDCGHMRGGATVFDDMNKNPYIRYTGLFVSKSGEQVWCGDSSIEYCNDASDGDKNTDEIIEFFSNTDKSEEIYPRYTAAEFCRDLRIGGYNDWYLPARQQLSIISTILDKNIRYLSSTEFANNDPNSGNWLYEYNELGGLWTKKSVPWDMSNGGHALLWDEQTLCIRESQ
ncbi:hypothetical protein VAMP_201n1, partial [Candidatus Vampirococcus lugosii]|nr:hypothetical protein [Candidatus Vampirococcus lugosii]